MALPAKFHTHSERDGEDRGYTSFPPISLGIKEAVEKSRRYVRNDAASRKFIHCRQPTDRKWFSRGNDELELS